MRNLNRAYSNTDLLQLRKDNDRPSLRFEPFPQIWVAKDRGLQWPFQGTGDQELCILLDGALGFFMQLCRLLTPFLSQPGVRNYVSSIKIVLKPIINA